MTRIVAITGATGFIGGVLAKKLISAGWSIRALVRSGSDHKRPKDIPVKWITGALEDRESLQRFVVGADVIVHCAGTVRGGVQSDFDRVNAEGVERLVKVAAEQNIIPHFILISSLAAKEPQLSYYAASKRKGEQALASFSGDMFWSIFRPPAVYGPGDREMRPLFQWMFRGFAPLIGSDKNRVSLLYVDDLVDAIVCCLDNGKKSQQMFELHDGHSDGYSWQEIIEVVEGVRGRSICKVKLPILIVEKIASVNLAAAKIFGRMPMLTPGKVRELTYPDWVAENDQISREIGWTPQVSLEEGLRRTFNLVL
jgi:2-alkyl-3-oxoalkanoate reductase